MTLFNILVLTIIIAISILFWRIRGISEFANRYINDYCRQHNLQLISVARRRTRLSWKSGKLDWLTQFNFEFSSTGDDSYTGEAWFNGYRVQSTQIPPHRIH